jgi:hypothetical protein
MEANTKGTRISEKKINGAFLAFHLLPMDGKPLYIHR